MLSRTGRRTEAGVTDHTEAGLEARSKRDRAVNGNHFWLGLQ
jgi:hypothetical protein